jgi:predicted nucleotide-binding protein (sugar kinase/HSP70/actin superfamily)
MIVDETAYRNTTRICERYSNLNLSQKCVRYIEKTSRLANSRINCPKTDSLPVLLQINIIKINTEIREMKRITEDKSENENFFLKINTNV